jgi:hypothetical protein
VRVNTAMTSIYNASRSASAATQSARQRAVAILPCDNELTWPTDMSVLFEETTQKDSLALLDETPGAETTRRDSIGPRWDSSQPSDDLDLDRPLFAHLDDIPVWYRRLIVSTQREPSPFALESTGSCVRPEPLAFLHPVEHVPGMPPVPEDARRRR